MTAKPDMTWGASTPCLDHLMRPLPSTPHAVADARVRNTGNIGIVMRVVATWDRAGRLRPPAADSTAKKDEDEEIEPRTFTVDEARELIKTGEIVDLKTLAGLAMLV